MEAVEIRGNAAMLYDPDEMAEKMALLKKPFDKDQIEKLPRYTGKKGADGKIPPSAYGYCSECGKRHPLPSVHLDYVGHAGITDRLNEADPFWTIEPMAYNQAGLPLLDSNGGMWCWMTVFGIRRMCYGDAQGKHGPNAVKELIGDAIRNGAMRFGCGTYLWSKSERAEAIKANPNPQEGESAPQTAENQPQTTELNDAKHVAWTAIKEYAAKRGVDAKKTWDGISQHPEYAGHEEDPSWYLKLADEFRANAQ